MADPLGVRRLQAALGERLTPAGEALVRYKLRTALSVVGIVIGTAAIVAMLAVGHGSKAEAIQQISQLGLNNIVVRFVGLRYDPLRPDSSRSFGLVLGDVEGLGRLPTLVAHASALVERRATVAGPAGRRDVVALGVQPGYADILSLRVSQGRMLSALDTAHKARVCVIGPAAARALFGRNDPVRQAITLGNEPFVVVGVLQDAAVNKGAVGSVSPRSTDMAVIVPLGGLGVEDSALNRWQRLDEIWIRVREGVDPAIAGVAIDQVLRQQRKGEADYQIVVPRELLNEKLRLQRTFNIIVGAIAALTLLVVGIMNIMLVSVTERTREIGLRRTVGATSRAIAVQFLVEATAISVVGGLVGLLLGIAAARAIAALGQWPTVISALEVALAIGFSIAIGIGAGWYPARRAAALDPIDALRYE